MTQGDAQEFGDFFLNLDDGLGFLQSAGEAVIFATQWFIFLDHGVSPAAAPAPFFGLEGLDGPGLSLPPPSGEMGGVEGFPAQEGADLPGIG